MSIRSYHRRLDRVAQLLPKPATPDCFTDEERAGILLAVFHFTSRWLPLVQADRRRAGVDAWRVRIDENPGTAAEFLSRFRAAWSDHDAPPPPGWLDPLWGDVT